MLYSVHECCTIERISKLPGSLDINFVQRKCSKKHHVCCVKRRKFFQILNIILPRYYLLVATIIATDIQIHTTKYTFGMSDNNAL